MLFNIFKIMLLSSTAFAAPIPLTSFTRRAGGDAAAAQILQIAPKSATCESADFPKECATNTQAAPFLISAMSTYKITSAPEIAAVLSLIAFESGDFRYNTNHFPQPGRPGQGTRAMFMPNYVFQYAKSIPALSSPLTAITTATSADGLSDDQLNAIRALVLMDDYTWGSAAWFLSTVCASTRPALEGGSQAGFEAYMSCVGSPATSDRLEYWNRAKAAFGIA